MNGVAASSARSRVMRSWSLRVMIVLAVWTCVVASTLMLRVDATATPTTSAVPALPTAKATTAAVAATAAAVTTSPSPAAPNALATAAAVTANLNTNATCDVHYQIWNATTQQCDCKPGFDGLGCQMCTKSIDCQRAFHDDHGGAQYACASGLVYRNQSVTKTYDCSLDPSLQALFADGAMAVHCDRTSRNCTASVFKKHDTWRGDHVIDCTLSQCDFKNGGDGDGKCGMIVCKCGKSCSAFTKAVVEESLSGKPAKFTVTNGSQLAIEIEGSPIPLSASCHASACERDDSGGSGSSSGGGGGGGGDGGDSIWSNGLFVALVASGSLVLVILLGVCCCSCCVTTRMGGSKRLSTAAIDREIAALRSTSGKLLEFRRVNCRVMDRTSQTTSTTKRILSDLSGFAQRGQVLGLLGPSGSGKTSLLNALAAVENGKCQLTGEVRVDGKKIGASYRRVAAYVQQDDALFATLTVRECLQYSAELRLPSTVHARVKHEMVTRILTELNLSHVEHARIGGNMARGVSGGERRRVSIGMELVTSPQILFLDEPTSGLDSSSANSVVQLVKELASHGRIVIMSIHQPSAKSFMLLDQVVLLAKGKMLYHDAPHKAKSHFENIGFKCPETENVADFVLDIASNVDNIPMVRAAFKAKYGEIRRLLPSRASVLAQLDTPEIIKISSFSSSYFPASASLSSESSPFMNAEDTALDTPRIHEMLQGGGGPTTPGTPGTPVSLGSPPTSPPGLGSPDRIQIHGSSSLASHHHHHPAATSSSAPPTRSMWIELRVLFQRTALNIFRHKSLLVLHVSLSIALALFGGLIFNHVTNDLAGFQNRSGAFYFILTFFGFASMSSMDLFIAERGIFLRETGAMYYGALSYFIAKAVLDTLLLRVLPAVLFASIFYWIMGLQATYAHFAMFQATLVLFNVAAGAISILVGVLSRSVGAANLSATVVFLVMLLFGGFLLNSQTMPRSVAWLKQLSIFSYAFEILMTNELKGLLLTFDAPGYPSVPVYGDVFLKTLGMDYANRFYDLAALAIIASGLQVLAFLFLSLQVPVRPELVEEEEEKDHEEGGEEKTESKTSTSRRGGGASEAIELDDTFKLADLRKRAKTEDADEDADLEDADVV